MSSRTCQRVLKEAHTIPDDTVAGLAKLESGGNSLFGADEERIQLGPRSGYSTTKWAFGLSAKYVSTVEAIVEATGVLS